MCCYNSAVHIHSCSIVTSLTRLLSIAASPVKSDGCATSGFLLCVHYAFVMLCLGRSPRWFIERRCAVGGRYPRRYPRISIRQSIYQLIPKQQRCDHFTLTYFICLVMGLNCSVFILSLNGGINTRNQR